jgi:hypothetical protein
MLIRIIKSFTISIILFQIVLLSYSRGEDMKMDRNKIIKEIEENGGVFKYNKRIFTWDARERMEDLQDIALFFNNPNLSIFSEELDVKKSMKAHTNEKITNETLLKIKQLETIQVLTLEYTMITDSGLENISSLKKLEYLSLTRNINLNGSGLKY